MISVLETALPSSLLAEALTNSAAVYSQVASEFAAGTTPSWFAALPTRIQTYLDPAIASTQSQSERRSGTTTHPFGTTSSSGPRKAKTTTYHTPTPSSTSNVPSRKETHSSLSTGAKVGIGVGTGVGAVALFSAIFCVLYRRKSTQRRPLQAVEHTDLEKDFPKRADSTRPYLDSKAELPGGVSKPATAIASERHDGEPQHDEDQTGPENSELQTGTPPPIPFASKPTYKRTGTGDSYELPGGFEGYEARA